LHGAPAGAGIAALDVAPPARGLGVALALIAQCCAEVRREGGGFLRGGAYDRESTRRFYGRMAVVLPSGETHLGGRAFRAVADLAGAGARALVAGLPPVAWNHEA
jgi:GNAT superfamily N-acetyltransferase